MSCFAACPESGIVIQVEFVSSSIGSAAINNIGKLGGFPYLGCRLIQIGLEIPMFTERLKHEYKYVNYKFV